MSENLTVIVSLPSNTVARFLFDDFVNACADAGIVVRCEPYPMDMYAELNAKALDIEKKDALASLEEEILGNIACVGGNCED
jgi:hypothetical protein